MISLVAISKLPRKVPYFMMKRLYVVTRDLHLYLGLFISPFILLFALSVPFLVHPGLMPVSQPQATRRVVTNLALTATLEDLKGREQSDAVRKVLDMLGVHGEIGFIRRIAKEHRLVLPVNLPGHETMVDLNLATGSATVSESTTGVADAIVYLHKMPGPHNVSLRGNSLYIGIWRWLADATVYLLLFLTLSGVYLWAALKAERRVGLALIAVGALSFGGLVYAVVR